MPEQRALFYVDAHCNLMMTETTSDNWSQPYSVLGGNDTIAQDSIGLAACVGDSNAFSGILVYYRV
jgi:hypothetical protein